MERSIWSLIRRIICGLSFSTSQRGVRRMSGSSHGNCLLRCYSRHSTFTSVMALCKGGILVENKKYSHSAQKPNRQLRATWEQTTDLPDIYSSSQMHIPSPHPLPRPQTHVSDSQALWYLESLRAANTSAPPHLSPWARVAARMRERRNDSTVRVVYDAIHAVQ